MIQEKLQKLQQALAGYKRVLIAFSGGVDSTFLLKVTIDILGKNNVLACIAVSAVLSQHQYRQAKQLAAQFGARLEEIPLDEMQDPSFLANKADRCFHCKSHLYKLLTDKAREHGIKHILCGSNFDDKSDYRPGNRAAEVFGILSPMMDLGLTKADIRELSRRMNLPTADLPASPCLASRIAYGVEISEENLSQIEKAEEFLRKLGFAEFRVRHHGDIARIEVGQTDIPKVAIEINRKQIVNAFREFGFKYITLDLQGFRSGSLNEILDNASNHKNHS